MKKNVSLFITLFWACWLLNATASEFSVMHSGAKGDGKKDNTPAFQKALDLASRSGGGTVLVPGGNYFFAGHLNIPDGVVLEGSWKSVPSHSGMRDPGLPKPTDGGTTFRITENPGNENGSPFITLHNNSTLKAHPYPQVLPSKLLSFVLICKSIIVGAPQRYRS